MNKNNPIKIEDYEYFLNYYNLNLKENMLLGIKDELERLKDFKFYTMLPALLAPAFIITGIVINQGFIIESKGWGEYAIAKAFMFYSVFTVTTLFLSGLLVDKFTSRRLLPFLNIPLLISLMTLIFFKNPYSAFVFMGFMGISNDLQPQSSEYYDRNWVTTDGVTWDTIENIVGGDESLTGDFGILAQFLGAPGVLSAMAANQTSEIISSSSYGIISNYNDSDIIFSDRLFMSVKYL